MSKFAPKFSTRIEVLTNTVSCREIKGTPQPLAGPFVTVSIPSNRSMLGIERVTTFCYSVLRLQEPILRGRRGARHAGRARRVGSRNKISSLICGNGRKIMPRSQVVNLTSLYGPIMVIRTSVRFRIPAQPQMTG